jgi:hypothetical protein
MATDEGRKAPRAYEAPPQPEPVACTMPMWC